MRQFGVILDERPELAQSVIDGEIALDEAYRQADAKRKVREAEEQRRIEEARDEQKREDSAGRYFDNHQEAKAWLDEKPQGAFPTMREAYAAYMEHDREARRIEAEKRRKEEEFQKQVEESYERAALRLRSFVNSYSQAWGMRTNRNRKEILDKMMPTEREKFEALEGKLGWTTENF